MFPVIRRKVLSYLRNSDQADDVTQEIMLRLLKSKAIPSQPSTGWLRAVARNAVIDFWRCQKNENKLIDKNWTVDTVGLRYNVDDQDHYCQPVVLEETTEPDFLPAISKAIEAMRESERQALLLYADGYTYEEIAAMTKANIGTVKSCLHYARKKMQPLLAMYRG
jgi:RNA polymerase sigma-70 factor (ECF subfamily)